jgi:hypothetical protein
LDVFLVNPSYLYVTSAGTSLACLNGNATPTDELTNALLLSYDSGQFAFPSFPYPSVLVYVRIAIQNAAANAPLVVGTLADSVQGIVAYTTAAAVPVLPFSKQLVINQTSASSYTTLTATVTPKGYPSTVKWTATAAGSIGAATVVTTTGAVTVTTSGSVQFAATSTVDDTFETSATLPVSNANPSLTLSQTAVLVNGVGNGEVLVQVSGTSPVDFPATVKWSSSNLGIAEVDHLTGIVTPVTTGTVSIVATSTVTNTSASIGVVFNALPTRLVINQTMVNGNPVLSTSFTPASDAADVTWLSSSDPATATINPTTGVLTIFQSGIMTVTARSVKNPHTFATVKIAVAGPTVPIPPAPPTKPKPTPSLPNIKSSHGMSHRTRSTVVAVCGAVLFATALVLCIVYFQRVLRKT